MISAPPERQIQRTFRSIAGCFFVIGWLIPTMLAQMPLIRERLDLSEDRISWFILAMGLGAVPSMLASGFALSRIGTRQGALIFFPLLLIFPPLFGAVGTFGALLLTGFVLGLFSGFFDVAANTHGSLLERVTDRLFMTSIHAYFALGVLVGSALSALAQYAQMPTTLFLGLLSLASTPLWFFIWRDFLGFELEQQIDAGDGEATKGRFPRLSLFLLCSLCVLMLLGIVAEASHYDWLALYATTVFGGVDPNTGAEVILPAHWGSISLMIFSAGLLLARLIGDRLAERMGRPKLLAIFSLLGIVALIWVVRSPTLMLALPAMFVMGFGFAMFFPIFVAAAGRINGIPPAFGVSIVAAMGWASIFIGPPMVGFIAEHFSYRWAYTALIPPALFVAIVGPWVVYKSRPENH